MQYELYHHGIKGQKWGVRRFQNADGTRTSAGKARERESDSGSKNVFSVKATAHKIAAKTYEINENTYKKSNKTLASMNSAAKNEQLKKAAEAQKKANEKAKERAQVKANKVAQAKEINKVKKEVIKNSTLAEKLTYKPYVAKMVARNVVKNNMSMAEAKKSAKRKAWIATGVAVVANIGVNAALGNFKRF